MMEGLHECQVDEARRIRSRYSNILNIHESQVLYMGVGHRVTKSGKWDVEAVLGITGRWGVFRKENYYKEKCSVGK